MTDPVFDEIYRTNGWNGVESLSGPGSSTAATIRLVPHLLRLVEHLGVQSVLDVACGDGFWMPNLPGYLGIDVSRVAISAARARHPDRRYLVASADAENVQREGPFGLVILRDVVQHLPLIAGAALLTAIRRTRSTWLLATTYVDGVNVDVEAGEAYRPDLRAAPFFLPAPRTVIFDGWDYGVGDPIRDPGRVLGLWPL